MGTNFVHNVILFLTGKHLRIRIVAEAWAREVVSYGNPDVEKEKHFLQ